MASQVVAQSRPAGRNWMLWLGVSFSLLVVALAAAGPLLASHDPLQENYIAEVGGRYIRPPFPPGAENYRLGTDEFGRDLFSRLLWAVRPSLTLAAVAAALRLTAGVLLGLLAGWSVGRGGRALDTIISAALAVPVLFVALCVVAALARRWGVWAFILGLSITGWAEAARLVQEQVRAIKVQPFIEASRAMGGSGGQVAFSHVLPHILPFMGIQLAFEVSGALLTTAALGFLGYYVNAVWIPIEDWVGLRASGMPELSQMLGVAVQSQPWTAVFAGSLVFFIVLAFNLLGEGLRLQHSPERRRSRAAAALQPAAGNQPAAGKLSGAGTLLPGASSWLGERIYLGLTQWRRTAAVAGAFAGLALLVVGGGWLLVSAQSGGMEPSQVTLPGGHFWSMDLRDAQGTLWSDARGPAEGALAWTGRAPARLIGGPVIDRAGRLYLNGNDARLYRFEADGAPLDALDLPVQPVGAPALRPDGSLVVADVEAGLSAFEPGGGLLWQYRSDPPDQGLASPITRSDGMTYIVVRSYIVAVNPAGERAWQILLPTFSFTSPIPRLSLDERYLLFEDTIVDASSGLRLFSQTGEPMDRYVTGADGKTYFNSMTGFMEWQPTEKGAVMIPRITLDARLLLTSYRTPFLVGVSPAGQAWLLYSSGFEYMRLILVPPGSQAPQITDFPYRVGRLIAIDSEGTGYLCGLAGGALECRAVRLENGMVLWRLTLDTSSVPVGGALAGGRLYVAAEDGSLFAIGR